MSTPDSLRWFKRSATKALPESEPRYRSLFEHMAEGVVYLRVLFENGEPRDAIYLEVNPAWERMSGLKNVVGRKMSEVLPGFRAMRPEPFERVSRVAVTGRAERFETYSTPLKKWLSISAYCPWKDHVIVVHDDITERKRAQDQLRLVIDTIPAMAWSLRPDGVVDFLNQRWTDYAGLTLEQYVQDPTGPIHPEDLPRVFKKWRAAMAAGESSEDEMRLRRADGEYRWFLVRTVPLRDEHGNIVKWLGSSTDIEDRREAEEALRESEHRLRTILRTAMDGFWRADVQGRFLEVNEAYCRMSGYSEQELLAMSISDVEAQEMPSEVVAHIRSMMARGEDRFESRHRRKDGSIFPVEVSAQYKTSDGGQLVAFVRDITERMRAERALRESTDRLQHLSRRLLAVQEEERRHLSRELHDEFGQLLATITVHLHAAKGLAGDDARSRLEECSVLLQRAGAQVRSLALELRPAMLESAGLEPTLRWLAEQHRQHTGIATQVVGHLHDVPGDLAIACFRAAQEALTNVVRHARAQHVWIELSETDDALEFFVRDDGVGFDVTRTLDRAASRGHLGLLGMKERVQILGGDLKVDSEPGHGTCIRISLPLAEPIPQPAESRA